jgi:pimeloyl-ACP methyl ester carboxylesterase
VTLPTTTTYTVDGVAVRRHRPPSTDRPPVVLVHGGAHAGWVWDRVAGHLAGHGWDCHALDWRHHGSSARLPEADFVGRGIAAVQDEIASVASGLGDVHLIGHSMGGLATLVSAATLTPLSLTLITPVVPAQVEPPPIPVPLDLTVPWAVPPLPVAKAMFFSSMTDEEAATYHAKLQPESPQAVWEATRWTVPVDLAAVHARTLVLGAGEDTLTPAEHVEALATLMGARYLFFPALGHTDVLVKETGWQEVATAVEEWLRASD